MLPLRRGFPRRLRRQASLIAVVSATALATPCFSATPANAATRTTTTTTTTPVQAAVTVPPADTAPSSQTSKGDAKGEGSTLTIPIVDDPDDIPIDTIAPSAPTVPKKKVTTTTAPNIAPTGVWQCPLPNGKFTNDWGQPRSGGRSHEGTDMLAPHGSPVYAPVAGTVKRTNGSMSGLTFYLTGEDGVTYVGMHLSGYGAVGTVKAGQVIGYVGDTGNARGTNHLHFEIHPTKRTKTNPYPTLKKYC